MKSSEYPWVDLYRFTEPGINAEGVRIYPFNWLFPIDVSFQRASNARLVRLNRHEFFEVIYMFSGTANVQVRDRVLPARAGDLVVIGPNLYHRVMHPQGKTLKLVSMNFHPDIVRSPNTDAEEGYYLSPFLRQGPTFAHVISKSTRSSRDIRDFIFKIHRELPAGTVLNRMAIRTYLKMILFWLFEHYANSFESFDLLDHGQKTLQRLQPAFSLLTRDFARTITVEDAARVCAMSSSHFMRLFKITVGQTFCSYANSFRIAKAQHLLMDREVSLADISQLVGFCSQSYFGEVFRSVVGTTPRNYRHRSLS